MIKSDLSAVAKAVWISTKKNSDKILVGIGIAGMLTTTVMAVGVTPKALILIEEEKSKKKDEEFTKIDTIKTCWKCYVPALITGTLSTACIIGASSVNAKRNAALATAYALSESTLKEYQEKVIETVGEKKEKTIKDSIAKDKLEQHPVTKQEVILTKKGDTLCYDTISGRYFKSDIDKIKKGVNELNRRLVNEMYVSLNDFYDELGLASIGIGDDLGWNVNNTGLVDVEFSSQLADDGTPCLVIEYFIEPRYDYSKLL